MSDMADVIRAHRLGAGEDWDGDAWQFCSCQGDRAADLKGEYADHLAAALSAAGFGLIRTDEQRLMLAATLAYEAVEDSALDQARSDAWDKCVQSDTPWINPYRNGLERENN